MSASDATTRSRKPPSDGPATLDADPRGTARTHFRFGWWSLLAFLTLGIVLEGMHAFKFGWYLNVANEARRLMWTLAHAHGTLLSLVNIIFALTVATLRQWPAKSRLIASRCLLSGTVLMPAGFFLGGVVIYDGDPGIGVALVPVGALLLLISVVLTARGTGTFSS